MQMQMIKPGAGFRKRNLWRRQAQIGRVIYKNHKFGEDRWWFATHNKLHTDMLWECIIKDVMRPSRKDFI